MIPLILNALADDFTLHESIKLRERDVSYDFCQGRLSFAKMHIDNGNYDKALEYMDKARGSFDEGNIKFTRHREQTAEMYNILAIRLSKAGRKIVYIE